MNVPNDCFDDRLSTQTQSVYNVPHLNGHVALRQGMMCSMTSSSNACLS